MHHKCKKSAACFLQVEEMDDHGSPQLSIRFSFKQCCYLTIRSSCYSDSTEQYA